MTEKPFAPTIRTPSDLRSAWQHLMGPWSFSRQSVWMMLIVDDVPLPQLTEITDADTPDDEIRDNLATIVAMLASEVAPGARFAFLRSRPGADIVTEHDRQWASTLYAVGRTAGVPCEVVHLATRAAIRPIPPDDVELMAATG